MEYYKLAMYRDDLSDIPDYPLKPGFKLKLFQNGDRKDWAEIETSVDEFDNVEKALDRFKREFGDHIKKMENRCVFLVSPSDELIGTTTAWYGNWHDKGNIGRIHWVAVKPEFQGMGLAKPLLSKALNIMSKYHDCAYLTTQTTSWRAVNMYLSYGFKPVKRAMSDPDFNKGWKVIQNKLKKTII